MSGRRKGGADPPRMVTRIAEAPTFDYRELLRPRLRLMPQLPTPMAPSVLPQLDPLGATRCWTGVCARCGRTLISATGRVRPGTVCHRSCTGRR